jgi:hypothetical protein
MAMTIPQIISHKANLPAIHPPLRDDRHRSCSTQPEVKDCNTFLVKCQYRKFISVKAK